MGIPQGFILDPILFLLFINDLPNCINKCQCNMFADDTMIYSQSPTLDGVRSYLQNDVDKLISWLDMKKLHVNVSKSSCMVLSTRKNMTNLEVTINNSPVQTVSNVSYLGVKISPNLSWDSQINSTCKKLGHGIYMLRKLKDKVPINDLITIYKTIIQPHIESVSRCGVMLPAINYLRYKCYKIVL